MKDQKFATKLFDREGFVLTLHTTRGLIHSKTEMALQYPINGTPHLLSRIDSCYRYVTTLNELSAAGCHIHTYLQRAIHYMGPKSVAIIDKFQEVMLAATLDGEIDKMLKVHAAKTRHDYPILPEYCKTETGADFKLFPTDDLEINLTFHTLPSGRITQFVTISDGDTISQHDRDLPFTRPDVINNFVIESYNAHIKDKNVDKEEVKDVISEINAFFTSSHIAFIELLLRIRTKKPL